MSIMIAFWYGSRCEYLHFFPLQLYAAGGFTVSSRHDLNHLKPFVTYPGKIWRLNIERFEWIIYSGNITSFFLNFFVNNDFRNIFALCHCSNIFVGRSYSTLFLSIVWRWYALLELSYFCFIFSILTPRRFSMSLSKLVIEC